MKPAAVHESVNEGGNDRGRLTHNRQSLSVAVSVPPKNTPFTAGNHPPFRVEIVKRERIKDLRRRIWGRRAYRLTETLRTFQRTS